MALLEKGTDQLPSPDFVDTLSCYKHNFFHKYYQKFHTFHFTLLRQAYFRAQKDPF